MTIYASWSRLCGDCGRTYPTGTSCLHGKDPNRPDPNPAGTAESWLFLLDRDVTEAVEFAQRDPAYFRRWRRTLKRRATRERVARARHDVAGARAVRNGALAALPGTPGHPAYRKVIGRLRQAGYLVENAETGQAQAQCPTHDDRVASLSVGRGRAGVLLHCKAGCTFRNVMAALGLDEADGFDNSYPDPALDGDLPITKVVRRGRRRKIRRRS